MGKMKELTSVDRVMVWLEFHGNIKGETFK